MVASEKATLKRLALAALIAAFFMPAAFAVERDKRLHFGVSFVMGAGGVAFMPPAKACLLATGVGVAKELADPVFDHQDLAADFIGACAGAYLMDWIK